MRKNKIFCLLIIIGFISGCAWGDRRVILTYAPITTPQPKKNITLKVAEFDDKRTIKDTVGYSRNAYGMRCAKVIPENSVTTWVTNALKAELINAGYTVSNEGSEPNLIKGVVFDVFCDTYFTYDGRIGIAVTLLQEGKVVFDKTYSASKSGGVNWAATSKSYAKTLELTLQDALRQVIYDINKELVKQ